MNVGLPKRNENDERSGFWQDIQCAFMFGCQEISAFRQNFRQGKYFAQFSCGNFEGLNAGLEQSIRRRIVAFAGVWFALRAAASGRGCLHRMGRLWKVAAGRSDGKGSGGCRTGRCCRKWRARGFRQGRQCEPEQCSGGPAGSLVLRKENFNAGAPVVAGACQIGEGRRRSSRRRVGAWKIHQP